MRVLFVEQQPCIRALKYAVGLKTQYPEIRLGFACQGMTLTEWYGTGDELFDRWWRLERPEELSRALDEFSPDLVHSHNLPDSLTVLALELTEGRIPVLHDVHDLQSLRRTPYENGFPEPGEPLELERAAVEGSAGVVAVSEELLAEIAARYELPNRTLIFPNYALKRDLPHSLPPPERSPNGPPRLVYQGTLSTNGGHYDLRELFREIVATGVQLDVYPGRDAPAYSELAELAPGMRCLRTLPPARLLQALPQYDFGWAGFDSGLNAAHLDTALPNKMFDYLGCGLPVLTLGHRALSRFVSEHGVGASLTGLADLRERLGTLDLTALRRRVAAVRERLTIEANVHRLVELYESVS